MRLRYYPGIFEVGDLETAKAVILTNEGPGADTDTRWALETPYVIEMIGQSLAPGPGAVVLDYGCGVGRLAKAMIEAFGCRVIGVDISAAMRTLSVGYVDDDRFVVLSPPQLDGLVGAGLRVHGAISVWVLQHCFSPADDIARIDRAMAAGSRGFILNMNSRAVPTVPDEPGSPSIFRWASDGVDVAALLRGVFNIDGEGAPDGARTPNMASVGALWMSFAAKGR